MFPKLTHAYLFAGLVYGFRGYKSLLFWVFWVTF